MKRLSVVLIALVMLGICSSSYGYFLIYKLSSTISGTEGTVDIKKVTIPFKAYLVMKINDDTNSLMDANMIIYGKDPNNHKVYVMLNASDSNGFLHPSILYRNKRNFYELNSGSPFDFRILIEGNVNNANIGLKHRRKIASSLSGVITNEEGMLWGLGQRLSGTGNISASIYTLATKGVNDINNPDPITPHTQDGIIDAIRGIGEFNHKDYDHLSKQYTAVSIPAP